MLVVIALLYPASDTSLPWIRTGALVVFLFAALTDWLDGWLARKFGQVSEFGKFMDALSDKVLTLGMFISLLALDEIARWALFPILLILLLANSQVVVPFLKDQLPNKQSSLFRRYREFFYSGSLLPSAGIMRRN